VPATPHVPEDFHATYSAGIAGRYINKRPDRAPVRRTSAYADPDSLPVSLSLSSSGFHASIPAVIGFLVGCLFRPSLANTYTADGPLPHEVAKILPVPITRRISQLHDRTKRARTTT